MTLPRFALAVYGPLVALLTGVVAVFDRSFPIVVDYTGLGFFDGWMKWDGGWYASIVTGGYFFTPGEESSVAFFPGYPLVVRAVFAVVGNVIVAGVLTTLACGIGAVVLYARWCAARLDAGTARLAVAALLLYPFTYFMVGAVYGDALFLVCALGAFALLERDHAVLAGLAGAVATATRPTGITLVVGLAAVAVWRRSRDGRSLRSAAAAAVRHDAGVLVSVLGLAAYCLYLGAAFDDPLAFVTAQSAPGWAQPPGPHTWLKVAYVEKVVAGQPFALLLTVNAAMALGALALVPRVWRRFGWGYGVFAAVAVGVPLASTGDFLGMGRYVLGAFPVFAALADLLSQPGRRRLMVPALALSGAALLGFTAAYARGLPTS